MLDGVVRATRAEGCMTAMAPPASSPAFRRVSLHCIRMFDPRIPEGGSANAGFTGRCKWFSLNLVSTEPVSTVPPAALRSLGRVVAVTGPDGPAFVSHHE
jgi:hypothetical protein